MFDLTRFRFRAWPAAAVSLILLAAGAVPLVLLGDRTARIGAAAGIWAVAAAVILPIAAGARRREQARQSQLDQAEGKYEALVDALPLVTWVTEPDEPGSTLYVSRSIEELSGYSPAEWASSRDLFPNLLHPDDRERVIEELEATTNGTPVRIEYRLLARDGRIVWVREEATTVRDSEGEPLYTQALLQDVGELKRSEVQQESLRAAQHTAAAEIAERQARLDLVRRAGHELASTLDCEAALARISELLVREFADWCVVDLSDDANELQRVAVGRAEALRHLRGGPGVDGGPGDGVRSVVETGRTRVIPALDQSSDGEPTRSPCSISRR